MLTLGGLGALAARDLLAMDRLVDEANGVKGVARPTAWAAPGLKGRWVPIMWRGRLVLALFGLSVILASLNGLAVAVSVLLTWAIGWWSFSIGVVLGGWLLPIYLPILQRWHYRLSGRAPGEPLASLERQPRDTVRVDPVPDEAFLPLAAALAIAFQLVEWGPVIPVLGQAYSLGLPVIPLAAGLLLPLLRAPPSTGWRSVRRADDGRIESQRPLGQRAQLTFGLAFVVTALVQAYVSREAGVFTLVLGTVVPVVMATAWYEHDRLARDVRRVEAGLAARLDR